MSREQVKLHEQFLSIFWNLLSALNTQKLDKKVGANVGEKDAAKVLVCSERLSFKFIENRFEKLVKLIKLHEVLFSRIRDFDLKEFT